MKRLWIGCFAAICLLFLCSCENSSADKDSTIASMRQEISELQERIAELEEENDNLRASSEENSVPDHTSTDFNVEVAPVNVELNRAFAVGDVMDITLTGAEWSDSVLPSNTSSGYSYYEDKENETYFIVHGTITSHANDSFNIDWSSDSHILVNGKYTFLALMAFEDLDGRGFGDSIKPLQTRSFIIRASVSDEVYHISESVQVNFELPDNEEQLHHFYDEDHSNGRYTITFSGIK